jgi:hypothetical protein
LEEPTVSIFRVEVWAWKKCSTDILVLLNFLIYREDGDSRFLQNAGDGLSSYRASHLITSLRTASSHFSQI